MDRANVTYMSAKLCVPVVDQQRTLWMARTDPRFLHVSEIVYQLLMNNEHRGHYGVIVVVTSTDIQPISTYLL